ncbi:MAG: hypothetical protein ABFC94_05540 [Syntrophomonas sp.]
MKKDSLFINGDHLPAKVIDPYIYQFTEDEQNFFELFDVAEWRRNFYRYGIKSKAVIADLNRPFLDMKKSNYKGIALEFSRLNSMKKINDFAEKYGLLGITENDDIIVPNNVRFYENESIKWGECWYEPLSIWKIHISRVQQLIHVYNKLRKGTEIKLEYSNLGDNLLVTLPGVISLFTPISTEEEPQAAALLIHGITQSLEAGIDISFSSIMPVKNSAIGYRAIERKQTKYLLAAIYYDLWQMVSDEEPVYYCQNPDCGLPINKSGRNKYCNDACKTAAYEKRRETCHRLWGEGKSIDEIVCILKDSKESTIRNWITEWKH